MTDVEIKVTERLHKLLQQRGVGHIVKEIVGRSKVVAIAEYKKEAPVDKGLLRNSVSAIKSDSTGFTVTTTAQSRGKPYPIYVHEGTGKYFGNGGDFPSQGRVRRAKYSKDDLPFFKMLAKQGRISIKPNRFAKRARETTYIETVRIMESIMKKAEVE